MTLFGPLTRCRFKHAVKSTHVAAHSFECCFDDRGIVFELLTCLFDMRPKNLNVEVRICNSGRLEEDAPRNEATGEGASLFGAVRNCQIWLIWLRNPKSPGAVRHGSARPLTS